MNVKTIEQLMTDNLLVKHYAGSISYGTNLPTSDVDFRGVFCADPVNIRTPFFIVREAEDKKEEDTKLFELSHFMKLCVECNPNIIETLWVDEKHIVHTTPAYQLLRDRRDTLLSKKIAFTTSGYALAQLKRIKGHNKWIMNPCPVEPPAQIDYISLVHNFTDQKMFKINLRDYRQDYRLIALDGNLYGVYPMEGYSTFADNLTLNTFYDKDEDFFTHNHTRRLPSFIVKFNKDEYLTAKDKHKQYWEWKNNRNEKRSALEEHHGFDTKHAMHLVRLLRMGKEALTEGKIIVMRPDAEELLEIRNGKWTYEQTIQYAEEMDNEIRDKLYKTSSLPHSVDLKQAAQLLMEVQDLVWQGNR